MTTNYLAREDAPFGAGVWEKIDEAVVGAAKAQLSARRLLETEGPFGLGLRALARPEQQIDADDKTAVAVSPSIAVPFIKASFSLSARDVAAYEADGTVLDLSPAALAAMAVARREDDLIFYGMPEQGVPGLLNSPAIGSVHQEQWSEVGVAFNNIMEAVNVLDSRGLHGPYALALTPDLYNRLFRLYDRGNMTELQQVQLMVSGGIVKSPALRDGGVLVAVGKQFASIVIGQDLATAFVGPECGAFEFCLSESLVLKVALPEAVCAIGGPA